MAAVTNWHLKNSLLLNPSKTEVLVPGTRQEVAKFNNPTAVSPAFQFAGTSVSDSPAFQFAGTSVSHSTSICVLGVIIDQYLTFDNHVTILVQSCNYNICVIFDN